jgi:hypothetical protein
MNTLYERFSKYIDKSIKKERCCHLWIEGEICCHTWTGSKREGYGAISINGTYYGAHRVSYEMFYGKFNKDLFVCHECDNRECVRPEHLRTDTQLGNMRDAVLRGRMAYGDDHGLRLHPERIAYGDRNGARLHPENLARGNRSGSRMHPERLVRGDEWLIAHPFKNRNRGDRHHAKIHPEVMPRGESHGNAKMTNETVNAIRKEHACGNSYGIIATTHGISKATVSQIVTRKTWRHVE